MAITPDTYKTKTALISVSDKSGIVEFATALAERGVRLISTGGTATSLREAGLEVTSVSEITNFPEIMDGRVKTLHPAVHGGLLAVLDNEEHQAALEKHGIDSIDIAIINLYPFAATRAKSSSTHADIIENIDIGGPAMVRASAKNYRWTAILTSPEQYSTFIKLFDANDGSVPEDFRLQLAERAFAHTAAYDASVADYFAEQLHTLRHDRQELNVSLPRSLSLRYGENPHQKAALFGEYFEVYSPLFGKELSYNNILDIDGACCLVAEYYDQEPTVAIIKHTNPCGVATSHSLKDAFELAFQSDRVSPFGGIIAANREIDAEAAATMNEIFSEVIVAPSFTAEALDILQRKKNRRLVRVDYEALRRHNTYTLKSVAGGVLLQENDSLVYHPHEATIVTRRKPTAEEWSAMTYAYTVAKHVKSNAIVYAAHNRALAIGAGQMSRLDSAKIATQKAQIEGIDLKGSAVASEAFFPFADGLLEVVKAGATAVIQPGGSIRDEEVIAAANDNDIAMVFTGYRHFKH